MVMYNYEILYCVYCTKKESGWKESFGRISEDRDLISKRKIIFIMDVTILINQEEMTLKAPVNCTVSALKSQIRRFTGQREVEQVLSYKNRVMANEEVITLQMVKGGLFTLINLQPPVAVIPEAIVVSDVDVVVGNNSKAIQTTSSSIDKKEKNLVVPATIAIQQETHQNRVVRNNPNPDPANWDLVRSMLEQRRKPPFTISNIQLISSIPKNRYVQIRLEWEETEGRTSTKFWKNDTIQFSNRFKMGLYPINWYNDYIPDIKITVWVYKSWLGCTYGTLGFYDCSFPLDCSSSALTSPVDYVGALAFRSLSSFYSNDPLAFFRGENTSAEIRFTVTFDTNIPSP